MTIKAPIKKDFFFVIKKCEYGSIHNCFVHMYQNGRLLFDFIYFKGENYEKKAELIYNNIKK